MCNSCVTVKKHVQLQSVDRDSHASIQKEADNVSGGRVKTANSLPGPTKSANLNSNLYILRSGKSRFAPEQCVPSHVGL
jgi:hypothetical protein